MAKPTRMPAIEDPDLTSQSDFQLLNALTGLVSRENSSQLKLIAWEIMRRYTAFKVLESPAKHGDRYSQLGNARWGDAKRVEQFFGIKRGVLLRLALEGTVKDCSLESEQTDGGASKSIRAKRLYCLVSIAEHLERKAATESK